MAIVFQTNAELGNTSDWDVVSPEFVATSSYAYEGIYSYKVQGNGVSGSIVATKNFDSYDELWLTVWTKIDTLTPPGGWVVLIDGIQDTGFGTDAYVLLSDTEGVFDKWVLASAETNIFSYAGFAVDTWIKFETHVVKGTGSNGLSQIYINNNLEFESSASTHILQFNGVKLGAMDWTVANGQGIYYDKIIVSTTRFVGDRTKLQMIL